jgi:phenylacetate-CoA ligase
MRDTRATVLLSTPSYAIHIGESLSSTDIDLTQLSLRVGCFGGEPGASNPPTRARIEQSLGVDAFDYYGLAEIGPTFASECEAKSGLHFAEDHVLVECLDPVSQDPVGEGETGVLVFTTLTREGTPMLRYWSNDVAALTTERCTCGRTHLRAVGGIVGRMDDQIIVKGAKFFPLQVERVVRGFAELGDEFVIEVEREPGSALVRRCVVVVEADDPHVGAEFSVRVEDVLRSELGARVSVRLEPVGSLARTTFKATRIVERERLQHE